jgi:hypothetical protein
MPFMSAITMSTVSASGWAARKASASLVDLEVGMITLGVVAPAGRGIHLFLSRFPLSGK